MQSLIDHLLEQIDIIHRRIMTETDAEAIEHLAKSERALVECLLAMGMEDDNQPTTIN